MALGQEVPRSKIYLVTYLQELENIFNVKFSYADANIQSVEIVTPKFESLDEILNDLRGQTQIEIQKLNERYYALSKDEAINICATVLDNFEQNTVTGATIQVLESDVNAITDFDGDDQYNRWEIDQEMMLKQVQKD